MTCRAVGSFRVARPGTMTHMDMGGGHAVVAAAISLVLAGGLSGCAGRDGTAESRSSASVSARTAAPVSGFELDSTLHCAGEQLEPGSRPTTLEMYRTSVSAASQALRIPGTKDEPAILVSMEGSFVSAYGLSSPSPGPVVQLWVLIPQSALNPGSPGPACTDAVQSGEEQEPIDFSGLGSGQSVPIDQLPLGG